MIPLTNLDIETHLKSKSLNVETEKETNQLFVYFDFHGTRFPLFLRIYPNKELLQLLLFIPSTIQSKAVFDLMRLINHLNKELDLPGFCFDEQASLIFYRIMLPAIDGEVHATFFDAYFNAANVVCQAFAPVILSVASGITSYDKVVALIKEQTNK